MRLCIRSSVRSDTWSMTNSDESPVMALLRAGVPISLLLDLADPLGPDSADIVRAEHAVTERHDWLEVSREHAYA